MFGKPPVTGVLLNQKAHVQSMWTHTGVHVCKSASSSHMCAHTLTHHTRRNRTQRMRTALEFGKGPGTTSSGNSATPSYLPSPRRPPGALSSGPGWGGGVGCFLNWPACPSPAEETAPGCSLQMTGNTTRATRAVITTLRKEGKKS